MRSTSPLFTLFVATALLTACATTPTPPAVPDELSALADQVEIRRTTYGVPQIYAENLRAGAFALAYVQMEDYSERVVAGLQAARGGRALIDGRKHIDADARNTLRHRRAAETLERLAPDTRVVYQGFADGVNHYIRTHPEHLAEWVRPDFTAVDVLARDITWPSARTMNAFKRRLEEAGDDPLLLVEAAGEESDRRWQRVRGTAQTTGAGDAEQQRAQPAALADVVPEPSESRVDGCSACVAQESQNVGSNAWALAPERTAGGGAILLRNPHLSWSAGYYEAHLRIPGELDFYGDFRVGGPFTVIGGFNPRLGFSTTNNESRSHEFYAFRRDPDHTDRFLLDGITHPIHSETVVVDFVDGGTEGQESREFLTTEFGPVVHANDSLIYIHRSVNAGDYRTGEQWLEMMRATTLHEWLEAMRIGARMTSNFIYADADGNIFYTSVQGAPLLPHPVGGDSVAVLATRSEHIWSEAIPFDSLPQLLNPPGGYVRNENDSPHYTNMNQVLDHSFSFWVQEPRLRLRSQHGIELLHNDRIFTLEDAVETKHSMRMLLADRVKDDLIAAVRAAYTTAASSSNAQTSNEELEDALELLTTWENTAAAESRGSVLFQMWWDEYRDRLGDDAEPFAVPWTPDDPMGTPHGLSDPEAAAAAFPVAVEETKRTFGSWDVAWGDVHRVRRGEVDVPVGGCAGALGCFRVLNFSDEDDDGTRTVNGGDGWVIAVQFNEERPRAYSVLGYGQTPDTTSAYHDNQAEMFAENRMKRVLWTEDEIEAALRERYRPGEETMR